MSGNSADPTQRFTDRVDAYARARPGYPPPLMEALRADCGLTPFSVVADIGSGTGILTRLFLDDGNTVYAVEPNTAMRAEAERVFAGNSRFHSIAATAEATTLPDASVDLIVAAQAFHWFDPLAARREFQRILRPAGWVGLIWNNRVTTGDAFHEAYEAFLAECSIDYQQVRRREPGEAELRAFFHPAPLRWRDFPNGQTLDKAHFKDRVLSSSYIPPPGHPAHDRMLGQLSSLFDRHQIDGKIALRYETRLWISQLSII